MQYTYWRVQTLDDDGIVVYLSDKIYNEADARESFSKFIGYYPEIYLVRYLEVQSVEAMNLQGDK
jgi:hypothetical protein